MNLEETFDHNKTTISQLWYEADQHKKIEQVSQYDELIMLLSTIGAVLLAILAIALTTTIVPIIF